MPEPIYSYKGLHPLSHFGQDKMRLEDTTRIAKTETRLLNPVFFSFRPPPGLLPVLGPLERYVTPTLDAALLITSRAGADVCKCR